MTERSTDYPQVFFVWREEDLVSDMATRGRKPKPTALKELEGNPGKRPLNTHEPQPEKKAPSCPKWLEPEARKEWRRLAPYMERIGILTEADRTAFASYCQAYARWKDAEEFMTRSGQTIFKTPSGYLQQLPRQRLSRILADSQDRWYDRHRGWPSSHISSRCSRQYPRQYSA